MLAFSPRRAAGAVVLALVVAGPALVAVAATPPPARRTDAATAIPPLPLPPTARGGPVDLSEQLDHLPLVVDDFPDAASRDALTRWRAASALEPQQALDTFEAFWTAAVGASHDAAIDALHAALIDGADPTGQSVAGLTVPALGVLARDPLNGGRLTDAAVALFGFGVSDTVGRSLPAPGASDTRGGYYEIAVQNGAVELLRAIVQAFGSSREAVTDLAYFTSVTDPLHGVVDATGLMAGVVPDRPDDVTARAFLAVDPGGHHPGASVELVGRDEHRA